MTVMNILIVGNGKIADLFMKRLEEDGYSVQKFSKGAKISKPKETVALHLGSGKELSELIETCAKLEIPILQGSTGQITDTSREVLLVNAENFALPVLRLIQALPDFAKQFKANGSPFTITLTESHQSKKKTAPGTALKIAAIIGLKENEIISIRDRNRQLELGVPKEFLDAHGYHWIDWKGGGIEIELSTKINGRDAYYEGGKHLLGLLHKNRASTEKRIYDILEFLDKETHK